MMTCNDDTCKKCCFKQLLDNNIWFCAAHNMVFFGTRGKYCESGPLLKSEILKKPKSGQ